MATGTAASRATNTRTAAAAPAITAAALAQLSQVELDDLFSGSPAGPTPAGVADGTAIVAPGTPVAAGLVRLLRLAWRGKVFYPERGDLLNRIGPLGVLFARAGLPGRELTVGTRADRALAPITEKLRAVYTFGSPMIGSPDYAKACNKNAFLHRKLIRYVYANDIVPQLPPKESGPFAHFGTEYQYGPSGWHHNEHPREQLRNLVEILTTPLSFLAKQIKLTREIRFHASVNDHLPQYYIDALRPVGVRSEFGD